MSIVYRILNIKNQKSYIGITKFTKERRWKQHCLKSNNKPSSYFHKALRYYGLDAWEIIVLENIETDNRTLLCQRETFYINLYKTFNKEFGYNLTSGGEMKKNISNETKLKMKEKWTDERKNIISKKYKNTIWINNGKKNCKIGKNDTIPDGWLKGIFFTKDQKEKMSKKKNIPMSDEHKLKIKKSLKNKPKSDIHKNNISVSKKGKPWSEKQIEIHKVKTNF